MNDTEKKIIRSLCNNNLSVCATARELYYHRSTIERHIKRIKGKTGLNPQKYYDLVKLEEMIKEV